MEKVWRKKFGFGANALQNRNNDKGDRTDNCTHAYFGKGGQDVHRRSMSLPGRIVCQVIVHDNVTSRSPATDDLVSTIYSDHRDAPPARAARAPAP